MTLDCPCRRDASGLLGIVAGPPRRFGLPRRERQSLKSLIPRYRSTWLANRLVSRVRPKMTTASLRSAEDNTPLDVLWEDGERLYRRIWRDTEDGGRREFLVAQPCAEHPTPA